MPDIVPSNDGGRKTNAILESAYLILPSISILPSRIDIAFVSNPGYRLITGSDSDGRGSSEIEKENEDYIYI